ncbi:hypothetical protein ACFXTO_025494 [Malus domestica]
MNEVIARLTRTVEEKNLQITALVSRLEPQNGKNPDLDDDPLKREVGEEEEPSQLQKMITNTIKAQYEGSSHTSMFYSKPYSKKIDALKMPRVYQLPKFMQFNGKGNPN